jgi:hypothetical protein
VCDTHCCTAVCVHSTLLYSCTPSVQLCVYTHLPLGGIGGYCILGKLFQKIFIFYCALELRSLASSNRASVFPLPRICRQYQSYSSNPVSNQIFDDVGHLKFKKIFREVPAESFKNQALPSSSQFFGNVFITHEKTNTLYTGAIQKRNNKKKNSEMLCR